MKKQVMKDQEEEKGEIPNEENLPEKIIYEEEKEISIQPPVDDDGGSTV